MELGAWDITTPFSVSCNTLGDLSIYATDANNVYAVFYNYDSYFREFSKTSDGATTWSARVQVGEESNWSNEKGIYVDGDNIFIPWVNLDAELILSVSTNGGTSFTDKVIDSNVDCWSPVISVYKSGSVRHIYVAYILESGGTWPLKLAYSSDDGDNWTIKTVGSERSTAAGQDIAIHALSDTSVYILCHIQTSKLAFLKSIDSGDSWTTVSIDTDSKAHYESYMMSVYDSNTIFVTWIRTQFGGNTDIMFSKSLDAGVNWSTPSVIQTITGWNKGWGNSIDYYDSNTVFVSYMADATPDSLRMAYTINQGTDWTIETIDTGTFPSLKTSIEVTDTTIYIFYTGASYYGKIAKNVFTVVVEGLYFRSTGTNAGYYTKDSTSPSLLTSKDSNGMINAGGSPSPYLDHSSATDYYRKEF